MGGQEPRGDHPQVIRGGYRCDDKKIYNNAAQHWNHSFFWYCISPFKSEPSGELLKRIEAKWKGVDKLTGELIANALANFGSGWTWLAKKDKELFIINTSNADSPLNLGYQPLLTIDVWEHAYYVDYRNNRAKYLETIGRLIDWKFVESNYKSETVMVKL